MRRTPGLYVVMTAALGACASDASRFPASAPPAPAPSAATASAHQDDVDVLVAAIGRFSPEHYGELGIPGLDTEIEDLKPDVNARFRASVGAAIAEIERRAPASDPFAAQDRDILLRAARDMIRETELEDRYELPYENVPRVVFRGIHALVDDRLPPERRAAALVRLERYAGTAAGYAPLTELAMARTREKLAAPGLLPPTKAQVEKDLGDTDTFVKGTRDLFARSGLSGFEPALERLEDELAGYAAFIRSEILPRARTDFREPPELYAFQLHRYGVDEPPEQLAAEAHEAFQATRREMEKLAPVVARARGLEVSDYRGVVSALKREAVSGDALRALYETRIHDVETIIAREHIVTLPARPMLFRLATEAETAREPAPHVDLRGLFAKDVPLAFVLPAGVTHASGGGGSKAFDDFNYAAASWTLTAHEGRPGHELQFSRMAERGLSLARTMFAFNAVNVEGWGLYSEALMRPYMPPDGLLVSLQQLLAREARAFLDPELQAGKETVESARRVLHEEVGLSDALAEEEIQRYTFDAPGQATSYFYGYTKLLALRADTERRLGARFDLQAFHDFVLAQGLLPPPLLRKAVEERFGVTSQGTRSPSEKGTGSVVTW